MSIGFTAGFVYYVSNSSSTPAVSQQENFSFSLLQFSMGLPVQPIGFDQSERA